MSLGLAPELFWSTSKPQIEAIVGGANDRLLREHNERVWLAWHIAALQRTKRLPKLKSLLAKGASKRRQNWREQMAVMDQWVAHTSRAQQNKLRKKKR